MVDTKELKAVYARNFIFGVEDSLVSTVGLLSGIASAGIDRRTILITGVILLFVEALSMAGGSFLSEHSAQEYMARDLPAKTSFMAGSIMFLSYFFAGFIPLGPYLFLRVELSLVVSVLMSLAALFVLGIISARLLSLKVRDAAVRMFLVGGAATVLGVLVGQALRAV